MGAEKGVSRIAQVVCDSVKSLHQGRQLQSQRSS